MKRSQMIQIIKDALYAHSPQWVDVPDYVAETVLQAIEGGNKFGEGMLPPFKHKSFYATWRTGGEGYEWEPE